MKNSKKVNNSYRGKCGGSETEAKRLARLASYAIERGHAHTLRRHLNSGLAADAMFYHWGSGHGPWTLIETAARRGQLECFKALEEAGALISENAILSAVEDKLDQGVLAHLLAHRKFDPRDIMQAGCSWSDYANRCSLRAAPILERAISELERDELNSVSAPSISRRSCRFL
ncbi:hypothetical protein OX462_12135 [Janthinobacterium sp. SUN098]|uniref:hypothetical protein n=1 Tax=unclassified Janthinobacterium TaxID=2610881 RepID=UPI000A32A0FE|nr:hypothetical protein [Janthinobacterium sp. GW458P]MBE3025955.1 hypothetical protein [Janthinobacterium sp. GW458P]